MKELVWLMLATMTFLGFGCTDETDSVALSERTVVRLTPEVNVSTRNQAAPQQVNGYHLRYILEAYEQEAEGTLGAKQAHLCQTSSTFELDLMPGKNYIFLAWADYVSSGGDNANLNNVNDEFYITADLQNVSMNTAKWALNTAAKDAFCAVKKDVQAGTPVELTLKRPLAMMNIRTKEPVVRVKSVQISYPNVYTAYNVLAADVVGKASAQTFAASVLTGDDNNRIAYDYLFVHPLADPSKYEQGSSLYNVTINLFSVAETTDTPDTSYEVEFVPFSPNYRTNLTCSDIAESAVQTQVNVSVDAAFETPELTDPKQFINSSYIRTSFYETGRIFTKSLQTCNDLIYLVANPYFGGPLYFEIPESSFSLPAGATWMTSYADRKGVVSLDGTAQLDARADILNKATGEFPKFTFATWVYLDEWHAGSFLFKKQNGTNAPKVGLKLGESAGQLIFFVDNTTHTYTASSLQTGAWHHVALVHDGVAKSTELFVDGGSAGKVAVFPKLPFMNAYFNMYLGAELRGKLDETFFSMLPMSAAEINAVKTDGLNFNNWNHTKVQAYWKYDEEQNPGKDSHSWVTIMENIRQKLVGKDIKFRLGVSGGDWAAMIGNANNRTSFAKNIKTVLDKYQLDGVDLDFEWASTTDQFTNYSLTIQEIRKVIGSDYLFTVSLHPISYKITSQAVAVCDWISFQCYGPKATEFPYENYTSHLQAAVNYGIPAEKLVPGLPFYGTKNWNSGGSEGTAAYFDMVKEGSVKNTIDDQVIHKGTTYYLNSVSTIQKKVRYALDRCMHGVMSWDLATDCDYDNSLSLQRAVVNEIKK